MLRRVLSALLFSLALWAVATCVVPAPLAVDAPLDPFAQIQPGGSTGESARWIAAPRAAVSASSPQWTPNAPPLADPARISGAPRPDSGVAAYFTRSAPSGSTHLRRIPLLI